MHNVDMQVDGDELVIRVDLTDELGPSSSGKSVIVASTQGNVPVPGDALTKVGLNVYRRAS